MAAKWRIASAAATRCSCSARDETGATAIEYALLAGFVAAVIVGGVAALGTAVLRMFLMGASLFT